MRILFIHQNLPGQFRHRITHCACDSNNEVVAIGEKKRILANFRQPALGVKIYGYEFTLPPREQTLRDLWTHDNDNAMRRGRAVAACLKQICSEGVRPDVVYGSSMLSANMRERLTLRSTGTWEKWREIYRTLPPGGKASSGQSTLHSVMSNDWLH